MDTKKNGLVGQEFPKQEMVGITSDRSCSKNSVRGVWT